MKDRKLPEYSKPPLQEVALSVHFEQLPEFDITHFGKIQPTFSDDFPLTKTNAPLESTIEKFGTKPVLPGPMIRMTNDLGFPRVWYLNESQTELVQLQRDMFIKNWRRVQGSEEYPRYADYIRPNFERDYRKFLSFVAENNLSDVNTIQCEVTYVNHIMLPEDKQQSQNALTSVFSFFDVNIESHFLNPLESISFTTTQTVREKERPLARLIIKVDTAFNSSGEEMLSLVLIVRGPVPGGSVDDVLSFMDMGRETIVDSFDRMTSSEMHHHWVKKTGGD